MNFLNLAETNAPFADDLVAAASRVIRSGCYLHGPETRAFEKELSEQCGADFVIGVSNGLDALRLILRACLELGRIRKGDAVMVAANTYIASVLPVTEFGLIPVFVEPDSDTMNFSWTEALRFLDENSRSVSPLNVSVALITHLYGTPCWDSHAASIIRERGMLIVEDNAQAIGALAASSGFSGSRSTGALGDAAAFSFYPTKNIGALGDGGAVTTSDTAIADTVRALANYGSDRRYHNIYEGYNCRLDEIQAAMLRVKLRHLDRETTARAETAAAYDRYISNPIVTKPTIFPDMMQVWHQYVVRVPINMRDALRAHLASEGVPTDVHYPDPPYLQPCYEGRFRPKTLTPSIALSRSCISLPIANVSVAEAKEVARIINDYRP